jgi:ABC-type Mn2+/Zn2+ transport system permease subunit
MIEHVLATTVWHALGDPWNQAILRRAFLEVVLLGAAAGPVGCWIVLYGLSYGGESLAHSMFPGLVLAALAGIPLVAGGAVGVIVAALAIAAVARVPVIERDTAIAVVVTSLFGLGVLVALAPATPAGIMDLLFGNVLGVSDADLAYAVGFVLLGGAALRLLHTRLLAVGFDRGSAPSLGVRPGFVETALFLLLAVAIVVAVQALGTLLVLATLVGPAAAARNFTRRVPAMLVLAAAIAVTAGIAGLYLSYYVHVAAGAAIAGLTVVAYLCSAAVGARRPVSRPRARLVTDG